MRWCLAITCWVAAAIALSSVSSTVAASVGPIAESVSRAPARRAASISHNTTRAPERNMRSAQA